MSTIKGKLQAAGLPGMVDIIETADDEDLRRAVIVCVNASGMLELLLEKAVQDLELLQHLMGHEAWDFWGRMCGVAPDGAEGELVVTFSAVVYLRLPWWAEALEDYSLLMFSLLYGDKD